MDAVGIIPGMALLLGAVFTVLWHITPPESTYETVELEVVHTRKVVLVLAIVCLGSALVTGYYLA